MATTTTTTTSSYRRRPSRLRLRRARRRAQVLYGRTRRTVSRTTGGSGAGVVALLLGGGLLAWALWPKPASAQTPPPGLPGAPGAPGAPGGGASVNVNLPPGAPAPGPYVPAGAPQGSVSQPGGPTVGYRGPGVYTVRYLSGVVLRSSPNVTSQSVAVPGVTVATAAGATFPQGTRVNVGADARGGWVQVTGANGRAASGFVCLDCPEGVSRGTGAPPPNLLFVQGAGQNV